MLGHTVQIYNKILLLFKKLKVTLFCWSKRSNSPDRKGRAKLIFSVYTATIRPKSVLNKNDKACNSGLTLPKCLYLINKQTLLCAIRRNLTPFLFIMIQYQQTESTSTSSNSPVTLRFILLNGIDKINTTEPLQSIG